MAQVAAGKLHASVNSHVNTWGFKHLKSTLLRALAQTFQLEHNAVNETALSKYFYKFFSKIVPNLGILQTAQPSCKILVIGLVVPAHRPIPWPGEAHLSNR